MQMLYFMLLLFSCWHKSHSNLEDGDEKEFLRAVLQGCDTRKSFSENFYELLYILCPASVYCPGNATLDTGPTSLGNIVIEGSNFTEDFFQSYDKQAVVEARQFLKRNKKRLKGCCVPCSCEENCVERQNCCPAKKTRNQNLDSFERNKQITQECVYASVKSYLPDKLFNPSDALGLSFYMVTSCFSDGISDDVVIKCTMPDPDKQEETRPVYSAITERLYKNRFCAECNNDVRGVTPLISEVSLNPAITLTENPTFLPSTSQDFYLLATYKTKFANLFYTLPTNPRVNPKQYECLYVDKTLTNSSTRVCEASPKLDHNQIHLFKQACESKQSLTFFNTEQQYKNIFCMFCKHDGVYSGRQYGNVRELCDAGSQRNTPRSFTALLFDVPTADASLDDVNNATNSLCTCMELFDMKKDRCRQILCPPWEIQGICACVPFLANITGMTIRINLEIRPKLQNTLAHERLNGTIDNKFPTKIKNALTKVISSRFGPLKSTAQGLFRQKSTTEMSSLVYYYVETVTLQNTSDDRDGIQRMFKMIHEGFETQILGTSFDISLGRNFHFVSVPQVGKPFITILDPPESTPVVLERLYPEVVQSLFRDLLQSQPVSKLVYCKRVTLDEVETETLHNATLSLGWSLNYLRYVYWEHDDSKCLDDFKALFMPDRSGGPSYMYSKASRLLLVIGTYAMNDML